VQQQQQQQHVLVVKYFDGSMTTCTRILPAVDAAESVHVAWSLTVPVPAAALAVIPEYMHASWRGHHAVINYLLTPCRE